MQNWIFWQNQLAFHQAPHLSALADITANSVTWVVEAKIDKDRAAQGWSVPYVPNVNIVVAPTSGQVTSLVNENQDNTIHIFTGIHYNRLAREAFYKAINTRARLGVLSEPPIPGNPLRNTIIKPYHKLHRLLYGRRISLILAIGHMATRFYKSIGFPESIIFSYGYFLELRPTSITVADDPNAVQIMYLGQLIRRKGVDLLLESLASLKGMNWTLKLMGRGEEEQALKRLADKLGIVSRLRFYPSAANQTAIDAIAKSDVFVLPSRHDGWGAVVNESLWCGVPVICSDRCGAADLLADRWRGSVFKSENVDDLRRELHRWIDHGKRSMDETVRIRQWCSRISGKSAATFMNGAFIYTSTDVAIRGEKPKPPWLP